MPFKKRKEAKAAQAKQVSDGHANEERQFDAAIEAASRLTDPAEKALALKGIEVRISRQIATENGAIFKEAHNKKENAALAGMPVALGGVALLFLTGPIALVGIPVWAGGMLGTHYLAPKRGKAVRKKLEEAAGSHMERLKSQAARASAMADATVEENVEGVSKSPLYKQILATPGLGDKFAEAAAKHIATPKDPDADAAPPAETAPKRLRLIKRDNRL